VQLLIADSEEQRASGCGTPLFIIGRGCPQQESEKELLRTRNVTNGDRANDCAQINNNGPGIVPGRCR
jgi:hypothetical protein